MTPLYFVFAYVWSHIFGASMIAVRLLSVTLSLLCIISVFSLGRRFFGVEVGLIAALMAALSLSQVYYAQEIRVYAMACLAATLSALTLVDALEKKTRIRWLLHYVVNAALIWTHLFCVFLPIAEGVFLLVFRWRERRVLGAWFTMHIGLAALLLLWVIEIDHSKLNAYAAWIAKPDLEQVAHLFLALIGARTVGWVPSNRVTQAGILGDACVATFYVILLAAAFASMILRWVRKTEASVPGETLSSAERTSFLLLWALSPTLLAAAFSYLLQSCFVPRYFLYSAFPIFIFAAAGIMALPTNPLKVFGVVLLVFLYTHQHRVYERPWRSDWVSLSGILAAKVESDDRIYVLNWHQTQVLKLYMPTSSLNIRSARSFRQMAELVHKTLQEGHAVWAILDEPPRPEFLRDLSRWNVKLDAYELGGYPPLTMLRVAAAKSQ